MTIYFDQVRIYMHGSVYYQFSIFHQKNIHVCTFNLQTVEKRCGYLVNPLVVT